MYNSSLDNEERAKFISAMEEMQREFFEKEEECKVDKFKNIDGRILILFFFKNSEFD